MAALENMIGLKIGKLIVKKRGPDHDGSFLRVQWVCLCLNCNKEVLVVARDLKRYKSRYREGCYECSKFVRRPNGNFKYGRNANGFIDRSIIIKEK